VKKIPSLLIRDDQLRSLVTREINPACAWVAAGYGTATVKIDGTACRIKDGRLYRRYDAKLGKTPPAGFEPAQDADPVTGHWPGWLAVGDGPGERWHREAWDRLVSRDDWTYELIGPKVGGHRERRLILARAGDSDTHILVPHGKLFLMGSPRDYDGLRNFLARFDIEGLVWWRELGNPDCDKCKIKTKDFGLPRGTEPFVEVRP
jgi:hypothetical protein